MTVTPNTGKVILQEALDLVRNVKLVPWPTNDRITDKVFLTIQNNRTFMQRYLRLIKKYGINRLNPDIGAAVKRVYNLTSLGGRGRPKSALITSYQKFN